MWKTWLIVLASLLIVACDLLLGIGVWRQREAAIDQSMRTVERLSLVGKEHASRSFANVDHVLAGLGETLTARIAETTDGRLAKGDPELTRLLLRRLAELDNVRALTVINEVGILIIDSRNDVPDGIDLHDRNYFVAQRTAAEDAMYLDRLAISRVDGRPFIGASRRIDRPGGDFAGVVIAVVDTNSFHEFYTLLVADGGGSLVLARDDGAIYVQEPAGGGGQVGIAPTVFACGDPSGTDGTAFVSTSSEIVSCRRVPRYALSVIATTPLKAVLAPWRRDALQHLAVALLITVGVAVFTRILLRRIGSQEETRRQFLAAFNLNPDAVGISRLADGYYINVNDGYTELTGYARDELMGRTTSEIGFWAYPSEREKFVVQLQEHGQIRNSEIRMRHKDGSVRVVLLSAREFTLNDEPHIIFSARDVSELRQVEVQLSKLSQAVTQSPAAIVITDRDGRIEYVNPKFVEVTGYAAGEAIGQNPRILKSGLTPPETYGELWDALAAGREWRGEILNRRRDGKLFWEYASIASIKGAEGTGVGYVAVKEDITQRKLAEEQLRASDERFRRLVESSVLGIVIERDGVPLYANHTYAEIFGYGDPQEVIALKSLNSLHPGVDHERINMYRTACLKGGRVFKEYEFQGVKRDGAQIWMVAHLNTIPWNDEVAVQWTIVDITLRKSYEQQLYYQANFDAVTGLPNRNLALERLRNAVAGTRRNHRRLALLFIDLDNFKKINDTLGHALGDLLLKLAGERMKGCIRKAETVARMGGDEFVVILPDVRDSQDGATVAGRILQSFVEPFQLDGFEIFVTGSIGIALSPENGDDEETLLRNADAALYSAKEKGRNRFCFFDRKLTERATERLHMESCLRRGLEREEFWLAYQPLVDIRSGRLAGAEVLLRWHNESLGRINTTDFISLAESTGLIVPIGEWILDAACRQASRWQTEGLGVIPISVNVSSCQFRAPSLADAVVAALQTNGMPPSCLELEITERLLMDDHPEVRNVIERLKGLGVRFALDDFGTGYSSLSYLSRFPVDTLKIDKSFINEVPFNASNVALVEAIIAMAHGLHLRVIAEGVETREQLDFLRTRGCDLAQGYFFSAPVQADAFTTLARDWRQIAARAG